MSARYRLRPPVPDREAEEGRKLRTRFVRVVGLVALAIALLFLSLRISDNWHAISSKSISAGVWFSVVVCSLTYGLASVLLSTAWYRLLSFLSKGRMRSLEVQVVYARTQIAKYIPGNVFHLVGRHTVLRKLGATHGSLVGAALFEAAGVIAAAACIAFLGLLANSEIMEGESRAIYVLLFLAALVFPVALNLVTVKFGIVKRTGIAHIPTGTLLIRLLPVLALYVSFFLVVGLLLGILSWMVSGGQDVTMVFSLLGVFSISWIAGYITPGASAGIGVREAVIVLWLGAAIGEADGVIIAFLFRIVTIVGDLVFFVGGMFLNRFFR